MKEEDFNKLYKRLNDGVRGMLLKDEADFDTVDELAQEVWARVWRDYDQFQGRSDVDTWVFGITKHVAAQQARDRRRAPHIVYQNTFDPSAPGYWSDDANQWPDGLTADLEGPDSEVDLDALGDRIDALSERQKVVAAMRADGRTLVEIAEELGISVGAVASHLARAKEALEY